MIKKSAFLPDQNGQIAAIFLFLFAAILLFFLVPREFIRSDPNGISGKCQLGELPSSPTTITLPMIKGRGGGDSPGGPDNNNSTTYHLIRKNVLVQEAPIFKNPNLNTPEEHSVLYKEANQPGFLVYYPGQWGEVTVDRLKKDVFFRQEGIIFFVHAGADNKPIIQKGTFPNGDQIDVYTIDFYQDEDGFNLVNNKQTEYTYEDIFACPNTSGSPTQIMIPDQITSASNQQLQLEWFAFSQGESADFMTAHCKPAVYLYPPQKMQVNVKVFPAGTLTYTDPLYDSKRGWTVDAYPDGTITTTYHLPPTNYPYLYFESKVPDSIIKKPTKGWMVRFEDLNNWYYDVLPRLGLNSLQTQDFADYWNKALQPAPYYFVGVIDQSNVDQIERLEITPKPDYINRVRIYFERLDSPKVVEAPQLEAKSFKLSASSFSVVEWGGMVKNDPNHPFTCSQ